MFIVAHILKKKNLLSTPIKIILDCFFFFFHSIILHLTVLSLITLKLPSLHLTSLKLSNSLSPSLKLTDAVPTEAWPTAVSSLPLSLCAEARPAASSVPHPKLDPVILTSLSLSSPTHPKLHRLVRASLSLNHSHLSLSARRPTPSPIAQFVPLSLLWLSFFFF